MKIPKKRELQQIASNHLSDIEFKNFMWLYKDYTKEPFLFLDTIQICNLHYTKNEVFH